MLQAMLAGVASIKAQQTRMNVIGNNLANINTTAFKSSSVTFQDMVAQTIRGATAPGGTGGSGGINPVQVGLGVTIAQTATDETQGSLNATNKPTDLAIQGNGFFMVSNGSNISYTRDGSFTLDSAGNLVSGSTGQKVLGWPADSLGNIDTTTQVQATSGIKIPVGLTLAQATTKVGFGGNLNSTAASSDTLTTQVTVYDSMGSPHNISIQFLNHTTPPTGTPPTGATSSWDWKAYEGPVGTGTAIGDSTTTGNLPLYFDANGVMLTPSSSFNIVVPASAGAGATPVSLDLSKVGQLSTTSQVNPTAQDGSPPGTLTTFNIGADGVVTGSFSNGLTRNLGEIALTTFPNANGLERTGDNMWQTSANSGLAAVGAPRSGSFGSLVSGFLEQSNVDVGNEFSDLIITQRGFQANTKIVTTVDQMMQDLMAMKQ